MMMNGSKGISLKAKNPLTLISHFHNLRTSKKAIQCALRPTPFYLRDLIAAKPLKVNLGHTSVFLPEFVFVPNEGLREERSGGAGECLRDKPEQ